MAALKHLGLSLREPDAHTRLATYLNDHLGGAMGGIELARRACGENQGNEYGAFLEGLVADIEADIEALRDVMRRLGVSEDRLKQAAGWTGEKLGRLKLNGQLVGYSPLSRLIELEGLTLGVTGKLCLWLVPAAPPTRTIRAWHGVDLEHLAQRAADQRAEIGPVPREGRGRGAHLVAARTPGRARGRRSRPTPRCCSRRTAPTTPRCRCRCRAYRRCRSRA